MKLAEGDTLLIRDLAFARALAHERSSARESIFICEFSEVGKISAQNKGILSRLLWSFFVRSQIESREELGDEKISRVRT